MRVCLLRQSAAARGRTKQRNRGQGVIFPSCYGCGQGIALAERTAEHLEWQGAGRGWLARFMRNRSGPDYEAQRAARERLEAEGLLGIPPCLDEPPEDEGVAHQG